MRAMQGVRPLRRLLWSANASAKQMFCLSDALPLQVLGLPSVLGPPSTQIQPPLPGRPSYAEKRAATPKSRTRNGVMPDGTMC